MDRDDHITDDRRNTMPDTHGQVLESLERYWKTLRHADRIPARNDIVPSQIDHVLPYAFILQRVAPGTARFRVAGQKLHDVLKMDARGMPVTTLFHPESRDHIKDLLEAAFSEPAIIAIPLTSPGSLLRPTLEATMLWLPLSDQDGKATRILGALVAGSNAEGTRPRRFMIPDGAKIRHEPLAGPRPVVSLVPRDPSQPKRPNAMRPALRLVVNNG